MKSDVMDKVRGARDFHALTGALLALCEPFGPVHALNLVHNRGAGRVVCFIELESPKQQPPLVRALGAKTIDGKACLDIPVEDDFGLSDESVPSLPVSLPLARARSAIASQVSG